MTSEGFWIDPGEVRTTAPAFNGLGDRLSDIFSSEFFPRLAEGLYDIGTGLVETVDIVDRGDGTSQQMFQT